MNDTGSGYLGELRQFMSFLKNLWGILAAISVFFPLSSKFLNAIPLLPYGTEGGVFDQLTPDLITTVATVVALFVILVTFAARRQFRNPKRRRGMLRRAWISFGAGILSLLLYLAIHQAYREYAWEPWGLGSGDPCKLFVEIPLLIAYVFLYSLLTRVFMLLGMVEFFGEQKVPSR
jgi:hypothetical protein